MGYDYSYPTYNPTYNKIDTHEPPSKAPLSKPRSASLPDWRSSRDKDSASAGQVSEMILSYLWVRVYTHRPVSISFLWLIFRIL